MGIRGVVGGILTIGLLSWLYARVQRRRPSAAALMAMSDSDLEAFIRKRGLRTASDLPALVDLL
jgi:hypothetical protein